MAFEKDFHADGGKILTDGNNSNFLLVSFKIFEKAMKP
jgi:hypothetical protein